MKGNSRMRSWTIFHVLSKLYPEKVEGTIPSIEEIETRLGQMDDDKSIQPVGNKN